MAASTCIKCGNGNFELVQYTPRNSAFKLNFIQCSHCGGVVGAVDFYNIGEIIHKLAKGLGVRLG